MTATRIGVLTPSSNTVVEPYTQALLAPLFPEVTAHFARLRVTTISLGEKSRAQFRTEPMLAAADLLVDAKVHALVWNGTSGAWLGRAQDRGIVEALTGATGLPATTAILGLDALLRAMRIGRLGLVTPYSAEVQERIVANYRALGIEVVAERHLATTDNFAFGEVGEARIAELCREVATVTDPPEAVAVVCTNMRGPLVAPDLERELGVPILDSVAFTLWAVLASAGVDTTALARFGRLCAPIGYIPPAEAEHADFANLNTLDQAA